MYGLTEILDALWSAGWSCATLAKIPERAGICGNDQDRQKKNAGNWGTKLHLGEIGGSKTGPTGVWRPISLYGNRQGWDRCCIRSHRWDRGQKWTQNAIPVGHTASIDPWVLKDGCARGIRANHQRMGILIRVQKVWRELTQEATQDDQESVWDVDPSLKGPPAAHGWS